MEIIELQVFPPPQRIFPSPKENGKSFDYFSSIFLLLMLQSDGVRTFGLPILKPIHSSMRAQHMLKFHLFRYKVRWFGLLLYKKDSPLELHCMVFMWLVIRWRNWVWESFSEKVIHSLAWNDYFNFRFFPFSLTGEALATYPKRG